MSDTFRDAVCHLLQMEGGYVDNPNDRGGRTKYGITQRTYPSMDIEHLTQDAAAEIYRRDWWDRYGYGRVEYGPLATKLLDMSVNMGPDRAHRIMQDACRVLGAEIDADGKLGPATIASVNEYRHPVALLAAVRVLAGAFYLRISAAPGQAQFLAGWLSRVMA
ncbi:MAG: glycosyl hydrolase 108 family protein [Elusimicrobia bacterium]|nr:glycosyl hydrolase 108 family protein [Elusimicrobiota bacterium]